MYVKNDGAEPEVVLEKDTVGVIENKGVAFDISIRFQIEVNPGERLAVMGRVGQGSTTFLELLVGEVFIKSGQVQIQGKIAYLSEENFFLIDTVYNNLAFYTDNKSESEIE